MNQVLGFGITSLSVLFAAIVSGLRLKPYLDAGAERTPLTFAFYPALIAASIAIPVVLLVRWWRGKKDIDIGSVTFTGNMPFIALGCLLYILVAVTFFPYQAPLVTPPKWETTQHAAWRGGFTPRTSGENPPGTRIPADVPQKLQELTQQE